MINRIGCLVCLTALLAMTEPARAAVLFQQLPASGAGGVQSDVATTPYVQRHAAPAVLVDQVVWWGFHTAISSGEDLFDVLIDGHLLEGLLSTTAEFGVTRYALQLDRPFAMGSAGQLAIRTKADGAEWFWQSAAVGSGINDGGFGPTAFRLLGPDPVDVPSPGVLALVGLGLSLMTLRRRG